MNFWTISIGVVAAAVTAIMMGYTLVGYVMLALLAASILLFYRLPILKFTGEVKVELDKCSWPWDPNQTGFKKYKELIESTVVVIISVVLLGGFVTTCDWLLNHLAGFLTGARIVR
ncbi:MAG TPA: preprotein translocase subunit SecE [Candidatus Methylacidiphilales bacterium]|jgi:preprotein translocase subunit SecE|nr:preprotein translocase subunit SecE [Candidatus Methylacidiphilales bacterium]